MYYSSFGILAVMLHIIINHDIIKSGREKKLKGANFRYRQFLDSLLVFYTADLLWGFLVDSKIRILAYSDTVLFFATMALSVLLWTRYVVAFLDKRGIRATSFIAAGWCIFGFVIFALCINFFYPVIFKFTNDVEYVPCFGRYILLVVQFMLFILISVYSIFVSRKSEGRERIHYLAVGVSGGVMSVLIVLQTLDPFMPFYTVGCLIANCLIHISVEEDEKREQDRITANAQKEKEIYSQVSASLATDYDAIYYINIETGKYVEISSSNLYKSINVPMTGEDFYEETRENAVRYAHPDDRAFAESMYYKDTMKKNLEGRKSFSYEYRIMVGDEARYFRFVVMLSEDGEHFVVCDKDIQDTITAQKALREKEKARITFNQIAESLASNYDVIYYVDTETGEYAGYTSNNIFGELKVDESGDDFFGTAKKNISLIIHPDDRERMFSVLNRDYLLTALEVRKQYDYQYRMIVNGKIQYTRFSARKSSDERHVIIGVENIEDEVKREREHLQALNSQRELARRDELTGIKNKTAFTELENSIQDNIEKGIEMAFAIAICDLNDLKKINDTRGHKAGDDYIVSSAKILCDIFDHSPVFRIGGDEFAVFLSGDDFDLRKQLIDRLHKISLSNLNRHEGPVIAVGMAEYNPSDDSDINDVFNRADHVMYEDKRSLKNGFAM